MTKLTWVVLSLAFSEGIKGQNTPHSDYHPYELIIKFDNRRTHINNDFTAIYGLITGVSIHHTTRVKIGINGTLFPAGERENKKARNDESRLLYYSLGAEYDLFDFPRVTLIPFAKIGIGRHHLEVFDREGLKIDDYSERIAPLEVGLYTSYHLTPWVDLKTGGGWRWVLLNASDRLNNYFIKIGLGFHLKKLRIHRHQKGED